MQHAKPILHSVPKNTMFPFLPTIQRLEFTNKYSVPLPPEQHAACYLNILFLFPSTTKKNKRMFQLLLQGSCKRKRAKLILHQKKLKRTRPEGLSGPNDIHIKSHGTTSSVLTCTIITEVIFGEYKLPKICLMPSKK